MRFREKRKLFIISLKFRAHLTRAAQLIRLAQFIRAAHFPHPGSISTSLIKFGSFTPPPNLVVRPLKI